MEMALGRRSVRACYGRRNLVAEWKIALMERHQPASRTDTTEETPVHQVPVTV